MSEDRSKDTTVVVPLALTDFVKALRELIGAFRDVAGLTRDGITLVRRREALQRASDLDTLGFPPAECLTTKPHCGQEKYPAGF
jgi:hypothetical protein